MPMKRMALASCHDLKIGEWRWFTNHNTMGSTLWRVYRQMEASMHNAMEKMASLTYMPMKKWYLPWWVSSHGTVSKLSKKHPKCPENQIILDIPSSQFKSYMRQTKSRFEFFFAFSKLIKKFFWLTIIIIWFESKGVEQKEQALPFARTDCSNCPKITR